MPLTRVTSQLISIPSNYPLTGSLSGTASYAITASYAANAGSGGSGGGSTSLTGITFPYVSGSNVYTLSQSAVAANDLLLSVNGVVQTPTTDYTVSASSVTFTDSYPSGSSVNVRYLVTATSSSFVDLNNIVLTGTTTGDVYYPQTSLLMHFNGTNGSTTMTDNSKNNFTATATNGASISTAQSKFGGTSLALDGTNDYVSISGNNILNFASSDFTVECWVRLNVMPTSDAWPTNYSSHFIVITIGTLNLGDGIGFIIGQTKLIIQNNDGQSVNGTHGMTTNTWYHLAFVRYSNNLYLYVDGVQKGTAAYSSAVGTGATTYIGCETGQGAFLNGYIDELRITKGIARYTGNFTPSTTAFSNTGGDVGKALVVNSTATGVSIGTAGYLSSQLAKAWVNFDGIGTVSIRDSYNVSSITDVQTGVYTVNFSSTFSTIPTVVASASNQTVNTNYGVNVNSHTTSTVQIFCTENGITTDKGVVSVIVFSN